MALEKVGQKALMAVDAMNVTAAEKKPRMNVLDEDTFTSVRPVLLSTMSLALAARQSRFLFILLT